MALNAVRGRRAWLFVELECKNIGTFAICCWMYGITLRLIDFPRTNGCEQLVDTDYFFHRTSF